MSTKLQFRNPAKTPKCSDKIYSNVSFFDTPNFESLDYVKRRQEEKQRIEAARLAKEKQKCPEAEKTRQVPDNNIKEIKTETVKHRPNQKPYYGLRRPLEDGETLEVEPGDIDLENWSDNPYSTVARDLLGYADIFPLHMQKVTKAEEKDSKQVQTETRRHSVVTADYLHGRIKLNSHDGHDVEYAVFPVLHAVVESPSDSESEDNDSPAKSHESLSHSSSSDTFPERLPIEFPSGFNPQRRRISIAAGRHVTAPQPQVVRRRSLDYGGVSMAFVNALEAASLAMKSIQENEEEEEDDHETKHRTTSFADAARAVFDTKYAEETMNHIDDNLRTLEEFLKTSSSSESTMVFSDDDEN